MKSTRWLAEQNLIPCSRRGSSQYPPKILKTEGKESATGPFRPPRLSKSTLKPQAPPFELPLLRLRQGPRLSPTASRHQSLLHRAAVCFSLICLSRDAMCQELFCVRASQDRSEIAIVRHFHIFEIRRLRNEPRMTSEPGTTRRDRTGPPSAPRSRQTVAPAHSLHTHQRFHHRPDDHPSRASLIP